MKTMVRILLVLSIILLVVKNYRERTALDECVEEVESKCAGMYSYAISLEDENTRLNKLLGDCE